MSVFSRLAGSSPPAAGKPVERESRPREGVAMASAQDDVEHLNYGDELLSLARNAAAPAVQRAAQLRLAQLIDTGAVDFARFGNDVSDPVALLAVAAFMRDAAVLQQAADSMHDMDFFLQLAIDGPSTRLRQLAAEKIEDPPRLRKLLKHARGHDKNVFKIVKRKCDAFNAEQRRAEEAQAHVITLGEAIERHSFKPFDGAYIATVEHLGTQWKAVAEQAPEELRARVKHALERSSDAIASHLRVIAAQAAQASAIENADAQRQAVLDELRKLLLQLYAADSLDPQSNAAAGRQLDRLVERWADAARYKAVSADDTAAFDSLRTAVAQLLRIAAKHGTLRQQMTVLRNADADQDLVANYRVLKDTLAVRGALGAADDASEELQAAVRALQEWEKSRADQQAAASKAVHRLSGLIHKASRALAEGHSGQAAGMRRSIGQLMQGMANVPAHLATQLEQLDRKLGDLQDWKSFAVTPKRAQLIERMEALIGLDMHPNEVANRVRKLQEEWKTISKGAATAGEEDWEKFQRAAHAAYQPCREFFAAQSKVRQENLAKRKDLVTELNEFEAATDWNAPDWREVTRRLRNARQAWRDSNPIERAANKPVQEAFDAVLARLQAHLDTQFAENIERRKTLIAQAQRITEQSDTRRAIDEIKRLQGVWKNAGPAPHAEDQKLWEEFRRHCDTVFQRSHEEYNQAVATAESHKAAATALCEEVEKLASATGSALVEGAARIRQLRDEFAALGDLPRGDAAHLRRRFERGMEQFDRAMARQRARGEEQRWENLFAAANQVRLLQAAELASADAEADAGVQSLRESTRALVAEGAQQWPKGGAQAIKEKMAARPSADMAANENALRILCIRAEIATDSTTPEEDQSLRRNYQLQSLVKGFGQASVTGRQQMDALVFEWIGVGPIPTPVYEKLVERFLQCRRKAQHGRS